MPFVMIATRASSSSRLRTLSMRQLVAGGTLAAAAFLAAGTAIGYWAGAVQSPPQAAADGMPARPHAGLPFALERLGAISGRLFTLESQAAQLSKRIGVLQKDDPAARDTKDRPAAGKPGSGGPMLAPRPAPALEDLDTLDDRLAALEQQIALVSDATALRNIDFLRLPTRLPVAQGDLVSTYGNRSDPFTARHAFHAGLDFAAEHGTPILAAAGGKVSFAGFRSDYGNTIEIEHGNGLTTRYAHASKLLVTPGTVVLPGDRVALVGSTGRSTGPHLHFEVLRQGAHTDPRRYLAGL